MNKHLDIIRTNQFKKVYRLVIKYHLDINPLDYIIRKLASTIKFYILFYLLLGFLLSMFPNPGIGFSVPSLMSLSSVPMLLYRRKKLTVRKSILQPTF